MNAVELRALLVCPLSYELFQDPVTEEHGTCGHTFEKAWIEEWLNDKNTCPISRQSLVETQLISNTELKRACNLLDPSRITPITEDEMALIRIAAEKFSQRVSPPVSREIHNSLKDRILQIAEDSKTNADESSRRLGNSCAAM